VRVIRSNCLSLALVLGLSGAVAGCTSTSEIAAETPRSGAAELEVCHGYNCYFRTRVAFNDRDSRTIAGYLRGAATPAAERAAISRAVQYFEDKSTQVIGVADRAMSSFHGSRERGQMDCIDESENTRSLLLYLAGRGLLKHHKVEPNVSRGFIIDRRYFHAASSMRDSAGRRWVVDSWYEAAGRPPQIMPLEEWRKRGSFSELFEAT
jgi:hypothetical protein